MSVKTGQTEPDWPIRAGAQFIEYADASGAAVAPPTTTTTSPTLPPDLSERYGGKNYDIDGRLSSF